jgi:hypothetical protein
MLGHFWYADHCLGEFVARAEASLQAPLFAMTGDHAGRRYITARPTLAERALVPLVLYGPEVLAGRVLPPDAAGCHLDIAPTLIELCAPAGFGYWSLGQDLLSPRETPCGVGLGRAVTASWVVDFSGLVSTCLVPDGPQAGPALPDCQRLKQRHDVVHGVSWWRIVVGPDLTGPAAELATGPGH